MTKFHRKWYGGHAYTAPPDGWGGELTERQLEILELVATGIKYEDIGARLCITRETVKSHLGHIYIKLNAKNAAHAVAIGYQTGLLRPKG